MCAIYPEIFLETLNPEPCTLNSKPENLTILLNAKYVAGLLDLAYVLLLSLH